MTEYVDHQLESFLKTHNCADFEALWVRDDPWFEEPNIGRSKNGWSGVCRFEIDGRGFFLKKQENFMTYSIKKPLGESVAEKEFKNLKRCQELKIPAMKVAYFGVRKVEDKLQAMIMTEELAGYCDLAEAIEALQENKPSLQHRRRILSKLASLLRDAHKKGVVHHSLYPKHIFINLEFLENGNEETLPLCRFIDLEKAIEVPWGKKKQLRDLDTLHRRSRYWTKTDRLYFLLTYLVRKNVDSDVRKTIKKILSLSRK